MSPILVRPVREQLEHDRLIRLLQTKLRRKFEAAINPGNEQTTPVGTGTTPIFPDLVLFSLPISAETRILLDLAQRRLEHYKKDPAAAAKLIAVGASKPGNVEATELAAWTTVASTILNLDETITKE